MRSINPNSFELGRFINFGEDHEKIKYVGRQFTFLLFASAQGIAAPVEDAAPVQIQKDKVPDSTSNGNYLETQPTESHDAKPADKDHKKDSKNKPKGKNVTEDPKNGGVEVTPK